MTNDQRCSKLQFRKWSHALAQATLDEQLYGDKRKAYFCMECEAYHTSRERVKLDVSLLYR